MSREGTFKQGDDPRRNNKGRPPDPFSIAEVVRQVAKEKTEDGKRTKAEEVVRNLFQQAIEGEIRAAEVLFNRGWGMPKQTIETPDVKEIRTFIMGAAGELTPLRKGEDGRFFSHPETREGSGVAGQSGDTNPV